MEYREHFKHYYSEWLKGFSISRLVEVEENIGRLIDCDLFSEFLLSDETILLYELVRDECVCRLSAQVHK